MADILLVDDDADLAQSFTRVLSRLVAPHSIVVAGNAAKAIECIDGEPPLVVVVDLCLDERIGVESGFKLLSTLRDSNPEIRRIVLTGHASREHGIRAMTLGAASFLEKPVEPEHLAALLRDAISQAELARAYASLLRERASALSVELCGESRAIQRLRKEIEFAASTSQPVLLLGETGAGKSLCARLIHTHSRRVGKKFVHYHPNFAGGDIVQSELFGHVKGAFTGALDSRRGLALDAHGGTLFIDELDSIPADTQVLLLDLVQERRVRPLGADLYQQTDCRFIAATNRTLDEALSDGSIRRDLHHRIAHCVVHVPSLRERLEDISILSEAFLTALNEREEVGVCGLDSAAIAQLQSHRWPGNIRELQGVIESAAYRARFERRSTIGASDIVVSHDARIEIESYESGVSSFHQRIEAFKRRLVRDALEQHRGNYVHAAQALGIDRGTIKRLSQEGMVRHHRAPATQTPRRPV